MARAQVYLGPDERRLLDRAAQVTGATRSELIRRAIQVTYGRSPDDRLNAVRQTAGLWKGRKFTGTKYVDKVRRDLNRRLRNLGLE